MRFITRALLCIVFSITTRMVSAGPMGTQVGTIQGQWLNSGQVYGPQEEVKGEAEIINTTDFTLFGFSIEVNVPLPPGFTFIPGPGPGDVLIAPGETKRFTAFTVGKVALPPPTDPPAFLAFDTFASFRTLSPAPKSPTPQAFGDDDYVLVQFPSFEFTIVPTPASLPLIGIGLLALWARRNIWGQSRNLLERWSVFQVRLQPGG